MARGFEPHKKSAPFDITKIMDYYDLALSIGPPSIATALQKWSIPSNKALAKYAADEGKRAGLSTATIKLIENNLRGAVAENNLAATLVSFPTGTLALFHAVHDKLYDDIIYLYVLIVVFIVMVLWIAHMIGGRSLHDIAVERFRSGRQKAGKRFLPFGPLNAINISIYGINAALIAMALFFYARFHS
jgi:hypothetical protein